MSGVAIGKRLNHGYVGQPSRTDDSIIVSRVADGEIEFGAPVVLTADNKFKAFGDGNTAADFKGFAMREVAQASSYDTGKASYSDKEPCDALVRGTMLVKVHAGTPAPSSTVYVRVANGTDEKPIGGVEAEADSTNTVALTGVIFNTGKVDANGVAEVTILNRNL